MGRLVGRTLPTHRSRPGVTRSKDSTNGVQPRDETDAEQKTRKEAVYSRVKQGQVSRARQALTGAAVAPRTLETLAELQRRRPQERVREIPPEVMASYPTPVVLDPKPSGLHTTAREPERAQLRVPAFKKHHQSSTRRPP